MISLYEERGKPKLKGIWAITERVNFNKRLYRKNDMVRALKEALQRGVIAGTLSHTDGKLGDISHTLDTDSIRWIQNDLFAEATVLKTTAGNTSIELMRAKIPIGASISGGCRRFIDHGDYKEVEGFVLDTIDCVAKPSSLKMLTLQESIIETYDIQDVEAFLEEASSSRQKTYQEDAVNALITQLTEGLE